MCARLRVTPGGMQAGQHHELPYELPSLNLDSAPAPRSDQQLNPVSEAGPNPLPARPAVMLHSQPEP